MKPTTPIDTEMVFLRDLDHRLSAIEKDMAEGNNLKSWLVGGIRNALNSRIAEVTKQRDGTAAIFSRLAGCDCGNTTINSRGERLFCAKCGKEVMQPRAKESVDGPCTDR